MECSSGTDAKSCSVFVSSLPNPRRQFVPDDNRLFQGGAGLLHGETIPQHESFSSSCAERRNEETAVTTTTYSCLKSVPQNDARHAANNLDAHSAEDRLISADEADYCFGAGGPGATPKAIHLVKLDPVEILIKIRNETNQGPVTFKNHAADSAINEVALLGLHSDQTHISIAGLSFDTQQLLRGIRRVVAKLPRFGNGEVAGSITSVMEGKVRTVLKKLLLHMQVFYCKSFIEVEVELFDDAAPQEQPSSHPYDLRAYYTHTRFIMRPLVMGTIPDDDRILNNQAASALLHFSNPSLDMCEMYYSVAPLCEIDEGSSASQAILHPMMEVHDISITEQNSFTISLDCKQLYPIIKGKKMKPYPTNFKVPLKDNKNKTIPIVMKILPFKSGKGHISVCAEISSPIEQLSTDSRMTIQATAFNHTFGCLGDAVTQSKPLFVHKLDAGKVYKDALILRHTLQPVMLEMHAFYCKRVQIDVQMQLDQQ